jgi:hypothetical protein
MIHLLVLAVAALHLQDPAGDAVGDGTLTPPTAPVYANSSAFDLQSVSVTDAPELTVRVTMGSLPDPGKLPNGFSNPIIEVYLDTGRGGAEQLLPGSGMAMPAKHGWNIALRATGDEAYAVVAKKQGSPASWPREPVSVDVQGNTITLHTNLKRPQHAEVYALTGVYDPFTKDGWRPLTTSVSPWAFSSPKQRVPVVDLLAATQASQRRQIDTGVLAPYRSPTHGIGWLLLMALGLITAAAGLVIRRRVHAPERVAASAAPTADADTRAPPTGVNGGEQRPEVYERFLDETEEATLWPDADGSVKRALAAAEAPTAAEQAADDEAVRTEAGRADPIEVQAVDDEVVRQKPSQAAPGEGDATTASAEPSESGGQDAAAAEPGGEEPAGARRTPDAGEGIAARDERAATDGDEAATAREGSAGDGDPDGDPGGDPDGDGGPEEELGDGARQKG